MIQGRGSRTKKVLDRYLGIPLICLFGLLQKKRPCPAFPEAPRIALLKTAAIGDTVLVSAIARELRASFPAAHITFVCAETNAAMARLIPEVDEVFLFRMKRPLASFCAVHRLPRFDLVLDFAAWAHINALIARALPAGFRVGFRRAGMYRHACYDACAVHSDDLHEMDNYRRLLQVAQLPVRGFLPAFRSDAPPLFREDYAVLHPYPGGSMQMQRMWAREKWIALAKTLTAQHAWRIAVSGGPEDAPAAEALVEDLRTQGIDAVVLAGKYDLAQMLNLLQHARLLVTVNTGIMHLGAATGTPLVALHGATSIRRWGPLGSRTVPVASGESCRPCISLGFESHCTHPVCMEHITVDDVLAAIEKLFAT